MSDIESGGAKRGGKTTSVVTFISRILIQAFTLTFLAEWGDRSQLATVILATREVSCSSLKKKLVPVPYLHYL